MRVFTTLLLIFILGGCGSGLVSITPSSFAVQGVQILFSKSVPAQIIVTSKGTGETREKAIENALIAAVQEGIGVLVVSDIAINKDEILKNLAITYASGVVTNYKVIDCIGTIRQTCEISAYVSPWNLQRNLSGSSATIKIDGKNLYGQHITSKNTMIQRRKLVDYYFSQIKKNGLDIKIKSIEMIPSNTNDAVIEIDYLVTWNRGFKSNLIEFLESLERDTGGSFKNYNEHTDAYISWGSTGLLGDNRVYIKPQDQVLLQLIKSYQYAPISVAIEPFNKCDSFNAINGIFMIDFYGGIKRTVRLQSTPEKLKGIDEIQLNAGC